MAEPIDSYSDAADESVKNLFKNKIKTLMYVINSKRTVIVIAVLSAAVADAAVISIVKFKRKNDETQINFY